jgi:hypothetical protein
MSTKRTIGYVLLFIIVAAVLVGAGYALYHLGYTHGLRASDQLPFGGRLDQDFRRGFHPGFMVWRGRIGSSPFQIIPGLFSFLGILALITFFWSEIAQTGLKPWQVTIAGAPPINSIGGTSPTPFIVPSPTTPSWLGSSSVISTAVRVTRSSPPFVWLRSMASSIPSRPKASSAI